MSSMDKRAALVWLIAVASAIGLWVLMTGGPALAEKMLVEICVEEGSYLNLRAGPGLAYDVEMELGPGNRLIVLETRGEWALVVWDRLAGLSDPPESWANTQYLRRYKKMRVLICDRCGVVIEREDRTQCLTLTCTSGLNGMKMIHLCEDCREAFGEWMGENEEREGAGT